jgi:hypothetical protein
LAGFVAFLVGRNGLNGTEVFSPDGNCHYLLATIPTNKNVHLAFFDNKILACGPWQTVGCYLYNPQTDTWLIHSNVTSKANVETMKVATNDKIFIYNNDATKEVVSNDKLFIYDTDATKEVGSNDKIFIYDDNAPKVFDLATSVWSTWPAPPKAHGGANCMVAWRDMLFVLGGYFSNHQLFQSFNLTSYAWQDEFEPTLAPIYSSACIVLPKNEILVLGAEVQFNEQRVTIYDILSKNWTSLADTSVSRLAANLVFLGTRVFAIGGKRTNTIEEFHYDDRTWSPVSATLFANQNGSQEVLSVPAEQFQHFPGGCVGFQ